MTPLLIISVAIVFISCVAADYLFAPVYLNTLRFFDALILALYWSVVHASVTALGSVF